MIMKKCQKKQLIEKNDYKNISLPFFVLDFLISFDNVWILYNFQKMSVSTSKTRDNRKTKTSILFEIRQNNITDQNIQIGQSINIISLNTPSKYNKRHGTESLQSKNQSTSAVIKPNIKRAHQSSKLTIKMNSGLNLFDEENKIMSLHSTSTQKKIDINDIVQKYARRNLITIQKSRVWTDIQSFTSICTEFIEKIDALTLQNFEINSKIKKFQSYFKEVKTRETPEVMDLLLENTTKNEKNTQLKILNMERKIQTLNYIIKNYRINNKEEIKQFQKKINQYRPTIEGQLAEMLAIANKKNQQMSKLIQYFQVEWQKYCKDGNMIDVMSKLQIKDEQISNLTKKITYLEKENEQLKIEQELTKHYKQQSQKTKKNLQDLIVKNSVLKEQVQKITQQKLQKEDLYYQLQRNQEQLLYKYQALVPLENKLKQKQQLVAKNLCIINRIQNENYVLRNKLCTIAKNTHTELFNNESGPIQTIQKCSTTIQQLTRRFSEQIEGLLGVNQQLISFILHLYEKTKNEFEKIVDQYRQQLQELLLENKQLKNRLKSMIATNKKKFQLGQEIDKEIQIIQSKKKRCIDSQSKIQTNQSCPGCMNWLLHCGQINNLYDQIETLVKKFRQIE